MSQTKAQLYRLISQAKIIVDVDVVDVEFDDIVVVIVGDAVNVGNDFVKNWKINLCTTCV